MILTLSCRDTDQFNRHRVIGEVGKRDCVVLDYVVLTNEYSLEYGATYQYEPCRLALCSLQIPTQTRQLCT